MSGFPSDRGRASTGAAVRMARQRLSRQWCLRLRDDPFERHGRVWQWVVDFDPRLPPLT